MDHGDDFAIAKLRKILPL